MTDIDELAKRITRLEDIEAIKQLKARYCEICDDNHDPDRVVAIVDPARSDLEFGRTTWELSEEGEGTLVRYEMEMKPEFWIPPVIGPLVIKAALRSRGLRAARRVEALASGQPIPADIVVERS